MSIFGFGKKDNHSSTSMSNEEKYGLAWRLIVGERKRDRGLQMMKELSDSGFIEGTIALSMFSENPSERKALVKKAADAGNPEGLWQYSGFLSHSYIPDPNNKEDSLWENTVLTAAEKGSVDAMNEMGNIYHRRRHYSESMYWYAMANANGHPQGNASMIGIAQKWEQSGCLRDFVKGSPKFDESRHKIATCYLEMCSRIKGSTSMDEIIKMVLDGVPIAGYFAGDVFEGIGNEAMAYKMYNALALENDSHALKCYADMLYFGKGTKADPDSAVKMYLKAAELGEISAMFVAGEIMRNKNINLAAYWYGVSHSRGYQYSLNRLIQIEEK